MVDLFDAFDPSGASFKRIRGGDLFECLEGPFAPNVYIFHTISYTRITVNLDDTEEHRFHFNKCPRTKGSFVLQGGRSIWTRTFFQHVVVHPIGYPLGAEMVAEFQGECADDVNDVHWECAPVEDGLSTHEKVELHFHAQQNLVEVEYGCFKQPQVGCFVWVDASKFDETIGLQAGGKSWKWLQVNWSSWKQLRDSARVPKLATSNGCETKLKLKTNCTFKLCHVENQN